jgi:small subunit ribosomal protein S6
MHEYESTFVLDPGIDDSRVDAEVEKVREFILSRQGEVMEVQKWGRRKLAFEIRHKKEGIYTLLRFRGEGDLPAELDRRYRLNENILRYLTVQYEVPPPVEPGREPRESSGDDDSEDEE